ncbi:MAG: hypothetical protein JNJ54_32355 [Myxococcaceae bacterium]|nr:hypothetical protein [Myxococcaceae bacterium]
MLREEGRALAVADPRRVALVRVLPDVSLANAPLYLVSRPAKPVPPRVRALHQWLVNHLQAP